MPDKVGLVDVLKAYIKGDHIEWVGDGCFYKEYEIVSQDSFPYRTKIGLVWVRASIPDMRTSNFLNPADPSFFEKLDAALVNAKKCVDDTEETKKALDGMRKHLGY